MIQICGGAQGSQTVRITQLLDACQISMSVIKCAITLHINLSITFAEKYGQKRTYSVLQTLPLKEEKNHNPETNTNLNNVKKRLFTL